MGTSASCFVVSLALSGSERGHLLMQDVGKFDRCFVVSRIISRCVF